MLIIKNNYVYFYFCLLDGPVDCCLNNRPFIAEDGEYTTSETSCLATGIALIFDLPRPPPVLQCKTLRDLQSKSHLLYEFWNNPTVNPNANPMLIVGYCRNKMAKINQANLKRRTTVDKCYCVTLTVIGPEETDTQSTAAFVAHQIKQNQVGVLFADGRVARLKSCYASGVLARYVSCASHDVLSSNLQYLGIPSPTLEDARVEMARRAKDQVKKRAEQRKKIKGLNARPLPTVTKPKPQICKCYRCSSKAYNDNMARSGPERLTIVSPTITDYLEITGLNSTDNLTTIDRMAELSVAGMDIESMTCTVDNEQPEPFCQYNDIDSVTTAGYVRKIQKPIMISHLDTLAYEANRLAKEYLEDVDHDSVGDPLTFTVKGNGEHHCYRMIEKYYKAVVLRQKLAIAEKKRLATPLLDILNEYKKVHFAFFVYHHANKMQNKPSTRHQRKRRRLAVKKNIKKNTPINEKDKEDSVENSIDVFRNAHTVWQQSVHGKLEKAIKGLINDYHVFTFYG